MSQVSARWKSYSPYLRSVLRMVAGFMFMLAGTSKLFGLPGDGAHGQLPPLILVAGVLEVFGGALLLVGLLTRPVAFLMAGQMAVAYFQAHSGKSIWPTLNGGVTAALYCFIFLYLSSAGPGPLSLGAVIKKARARSLGSGGAVHPHPPHPSAA